MSIYLNLALAMASFFMCGSGWTFMSASAQQLRKSGRIRCSFGLALGIYFSIAVIGNYIQAGGGYG